MIRETCSCGATIEVDTWQYASDLMPEWRENHKHDSDVEHWRFKYEQCNAESARRRERVNELKAELILLKRLGSGYSDTPLSSEKPDNQYERGRKDERELWRRVAEDRIHDLTTCTKDDACKTKADGAQLVLEDAEYAIEQEQGERRQVGDSLAPSQPSAYDYDEGYCDCWRCDDSCQNSTENGTVLPEPPAGTPVWWDGEWWIRYSDGFTKYAPTVGGCADRTWLEMPGAVPALTPDEVDDAVRYSDLAAAQMRDQYDEGFKEGREGSERREVMGTLFISVKADNLDLAVEKVGGWVDNVQHLLCYPGFPTQADWQKDDMTVTWGE